MQICWLLCSVLWLWSVGVLLGAEPPAYRLATFECDVTIPLNHRCMGVLPTKSKEILDALEARGFVLLGPDKPVVLVSVDWCEIRNGAYDQWREALAQAAGTTRERVLLSSIHQHDAPVVDRGAQDLLDRVGLKDELYHRAFHDDCVKRVAQALLESLSRAEPVTHFGVGQAPVEKLASNRRVVEKDGRVGYHRGSSSGGNPFYREAPDGLIDPYLKTLSFWNGDKPVVAVHAYATHPMSYYGRGGVSADFPGLARRLRQRDLPDVPQIYVSGCSGDVTAGKYNDGSASMRAILAERLHQAMIAAWEATKRSPLQTVDFRNEPLDLPYRKIEKLSRTNLDMTLKNSQANDREKILAAMALSSLNRVEAGQKIDFPVLDLGSAAVILFPGESFVGYQLLAQKMQPEKFVLSIGYGECWPGYIPTQMADDDQFDDMWLWVERGCEPIIHKALETLLAVPPGK